MDRTIKPSKRKLVYSMVVGGILLTLIVGHIFFKRHQQLNRLYFETAELGRCVYLFVEDNKQMPVDQTELIESGYLEVLSDGSIQPGPRTIGRDSPLTILRYMEGRSFKHLNIIEVRYKGGELGDDIIWVDQDNGGAATQAKAYSDLITRCLSNDEKMIKSDVVPVPPEVDVEKMERGSPTAERGSSGSSGDTINPVRHSVCTIRCTVA